MLFGRKTGLFAAVILALCRVNIFYTPFTMIAPLQAFFMALLVFMAIMAYRKESLNWWLWTGLVCGLANCTRGNIVLMLPFFLYLLVLTFREKKNRLTVALVSFLILFYVPQLPYAWTNYKVHDRWVGPSSAAVNVLALGNTKESPPGGREPGSSGPMAYPISYGEWVKDDKRPGAERVSGLQNTWRWFSSEPLAYLELKFRMLLLFWHRMEIPNNVSMMEGGEALPVLTLNFFGWLDFWLIGPLALFGIAMSLRKISLRNPNHVFVLGITVSYCASILLFYMLSRFRAPLMPILCGYAGFGLLQFIDVCKNFKVKDRQRQAIYKACFALMCFLIVSFGYDIYRYGWEAKVMRTVRPQGVQLDFRDKDIFMDHGPEKFGSWQYEKMTGLAVQKKLHVVPGAKGKIKLRIGILSPEGGRFSFRLHPAKNPQAPPIQEEVFAIGPARPFKQQWVTMEVNDGLYLYDQYEQGELVINMSFEPIEGEHYLIVDEQRNYGRSTFSRQLKQPCEFVMQLWRAE